MPLAGHARQEPGRAIPAESGTLQEFGAAFSSSYRALTVIAVGIVQDSALAEDVVQEAAIIGMSKYGTFQAGTNFGAWMARIVQFVARNQSRGRRRRRAVSFEHDMHDPPARTDLAADAPELKLMTSGDLPVDQVHFDDRVMKALATVAPIPRICLLLRTLEDLEYTEIAKLLRIPEGTAMSHVHRARKLLREQLADFAPRSATDGTAIA